MSSITLKHTHTHTRTHIFSGNNAKRKKGARKSEWLFSQSYHYHIIEHNNHVQTVQNVDSGNWAPSVLVRVRHEKGWDRVCVCMREWETEREKERIASKWQTRNLHQETRSLSLSLFLSLSLSLSFSLSLFLWWTERTRQAHRSERKL